MDGITIFEYPGLMLALTMPWILLIIPGIIVLGKYTRQKVYFFVTAIFMSFVFYISYAAYTPGELFRNYGTRYFAWIFPWLGLFAYVTVTRSWVEIGWRRVAACTAPVIIIAAFLGWNAFPIADYKNHLPTPLESNLKVHCDYDPLKHVFISKITLDKRENVDGIRLVFDRSVVFHPDYGRIKIFADGKQLQLWSDYKIDLYNNIVILGFEHSRHRLGSLNNFTFILPVEKPTKLIAATFLQLRFEPWLFFKRLAQRLTNPQKYSVTNANTYEYGDKIEFGFGRNARRYLLSGWSNPESTYIWSESSLATLGFKVPVTHRSLSLKMNMAGVYLCQSEIPGRFGVRKW
jgi:hypothetical protein